MLTRWGILSTANINRHVLEGARLADGVEVVAVASRDSARAEAYARENWIPRAHGSYDALLADDGVDAVYIPLPNSLHHEWTLRALAAGKHVLCEKPYTRHPAEVEEAFDLAERNGLVLSEAFMWRHNPQTARFVELATRDRRAADDSRDVRLPPPRGDERAPERRARRRSADGRRLLLRQRRAGCSPASPSACTESRSPGRAASTCASRARCASRGDVVAEFTCSFTHDHQGLEAIGSEGTLFAGDPWHCKDGLIVVNGREERVTPENSYKLELENVSAAIHGEAPLLLGREDARGQARTIEALYAAAARLEPEANVREVPERRGRPEHRQHRRHRPADDRQHPARVHPIVDEEHLDGEHAVDERAEDRSARARARSSSGSRG